MGFSPEFIAAHKAKVEAQAAKAAGITSATVQNDAAKKKKKKKNKNKAANVEKLTEDLEKATIIEPVVCKPQTITNNTVQSGKINKSENTEKEEQILDPTKRLKTLKKKIREIETLELKIKSGEIKNPEKEMKDKILKKSSILKEIKQLEKSQ